MLLTALLLIPLLAGLLCWLVKPRWVLEMLNVATFSAALALGIALAARVLAGGPVTEWRAFLRADALSAFMVLLIGLVSLASSLYAIGYLRRDLAAKRLTENRVREFYVLTPLFVFAMLLVVLANNLGIMWVALEGTALASVFLVALYNQKSSLEAAWKYIMLGSVGLVLALLGTILTYASAAGLGTETLAGLNWSYLMTVADKLNPNLLKLAFVFILVGYGTKAGIAPMHTWLPDAHSEAPAPTSAMLSGVFLKVAFYGLLRFHILTTHSLGTTYSQHLLLGFGLFSMCVAAPFILVQTNLKRLFAYSSVEHIGIICVGIGLNAPLAVFGALLHMGYHALAKPTLFMASGNIHQKYHTLEMPEIGAGLLRVMPATAMLLAIAVVAATGMPPFGIFLSEFNIVAGGISAGHVIVCAVFLTAVITVFCGFLNHISKLLLGNPSPATSTEITSFQSVAAMSMLVVLLTIFSLWLPQPVRDLIAQAARIIRGDS